MTTLNPLRNLAFLALALILARPCSAEEKWGSVKGKVTWADGPVAKPDEVVVDARTHGVKNVFVWLIDASDPEKPKAPPINTAVKLPKEVEITIHAGPPRRFDPPVLAMSKDQVLVIHNKTALADNVFWEGKNIGTDGLGGPLIVPPDGVTRVNFPALRQKIWLSSTVAPKPTARVWVFDHPYFTATDPEGRFEIPGAPAGKYNIVMWVRGVGWVNGGQNGQTVDITGGKTVEVNAKAKLEE